jgi:HEAT repeat protein/CheY-like chemotaxis protein
VTVRILALDDEPEMVDLMRLILGRKGYDLVGSSDSRQAWKMLHEEQFDLLTQDLMRPDIDGWEFLLMLRSDPALFDLPVLIVTAKAQPVDKVLGYQVADVDAYVTKPFGPQELLVAIEYVLRKHAKVPPTGETQSPWQTQKEKQEIEPLLGLLKARRRKVREETVRALGDLGNKRAIEPLIQMLEDKDSSVRGAVVQALGKIGDPRAVEPLVAALQDGERVNEAVAWALGDLKDGRAVKPLVNALPGETQYITWVITRSLVQIGAPAIEPLIEKMRGAWYPRERKAVVEALGQTGDKRAVEPLIEMLQNTYPNPCRTAAWYLGYLGDNRAVEPLVAMMQDEMKRRRLANLLLATLRLYDENAGVCTAIRSLGRLRDERAVEPLIATLQDESADVAWQAADALGKIGDVRALTHLERVAREDTRETRYGGAVAKMAQYAIERIGAA